MEFDKSRIYTAVNAEELKVGSKCFFSHCIEDFKKEKGNTKRLIKVDGEHTSCRFIDDDGIVWALAYLI